MSGSTITVIVAARNAAHTIGSCVKALREQRVHGWDVEVIVVDNASTDDTAAVAEEAGATVVHQPKVGAAAARNAGIARATGDIIAVTDADCRPVEGWLSAIVGPLVGDPAVSAAKGTYRSEQPQLFARFVQLEYEDKYDLLRGVDSIDFVDTYSAAYRRDDLLRSGGFDEDMTYLEDQELSFRLAAMGCRMVFSPDAVVYHLHADSLRRYARKKYLIGYWKARVVKRFPNVAVKDSHTPQVMKAQMALVLLAALTALGVPLLRRRALATLAAEAAVFGATTVPFVRKAWRSDRAVAVMSPAMLAVRAGALSAGYVVGTIAAAGDKPATAPTEG